MLSRTFFLFLLTGGLAAAVNWSSRIFYNNWLSYSYAIVAAYVTGMITAFILARIFVFTDSRRSTARSAVLFMLVNVAAIAQTWAVSVVLAYHVLPAIGIHAYNAEVAHLIGVAVPVVTSYFGHKYITFR